MRGFVGPFFYIDKKVVAIKRPASSFDPRQSFFNEEMSHFEFFLTLGVAGDYGNYPRGRVIYDNDRERFIVYLDKTLRNEETKEQIVREFELPSRGTAFRLDAHYQHDFL